MSHRAGLSHGALLPTPFLSASTLYFLSHSPSLPLLSMHYGSQISFLFTHFNFLFTITGWGCGSSTGHNKKKINYKTERITVSKLFTHEALLQFSRGLFQISVAALPWRQEADLSLLTWEACKVLCKTARQKYVLALIHLVHGGSQWGTCELPILHLNSSKGGPDHSVTTAQQTEGKSRDFLNPAKWLAFKSLK